MHLALYNTMLKKNLVILPLLVWSNLSAQNTEVLKKYEDSLKVLQIPMYRGKADAAKETANEKFKRIFSDALKQDKSFDFPFDSLKEIGRIYSPDRTFRIINWDIPKADGTYDYFGLVQVYDAKTKTYVVHELTDKSQDVKTPETYSGTADKWYGMLYYKIIPVKYKKKKYYTLLGFDPNDNLTAKKVIDVLTFSNGTVPKFGADIFKMEKRSPKRVVFEYSSKAVMSLKYNEEHKVIVFDHLTPSVPQFDGQFQYYGPDFSLDALKFEKGKWVYIADVDERNPGSSKDAKYNNPNDKLKEKGDGNEKKIYEQEKQKPK